MMQMQVIFIFTYLTHIFISFENFFAKLFIFESIGTSGIGASVPTGIFISFSCFSHAFAGTIFLSFVIFCLKRFTTILTIYKWSWLIMGIFFFCSFFKNFSSKIFMKTFARTKFWFVGLVIFKRFFTFFTNKCFFCILKSWFVINSITSTTTKFSICGRFSSKFFFTVFTNVNHKINSNLIYKAI